MLTDDVTAVGSKTISLRLAYLLFLTSLVLRRNVLLFHIELGQC